MLKRNLLILLLFVAVAGAGYFVRTECLRFPTVDEMRNYQRAHSTSSIKSISVEDFIKKSTGDEVRVFKVTHTPSGKEEVVYVETTKRWVLPWNDYRWKIDKGEEYNE